VEDFVKFNYTICRLQIRVSVAGQIRRPVDFAFQLGDHSKHEVKKTPKKSWFMLRLLGRMSSMTKAVFFRFELDDYERVTTMKNIILKSEETVSGMKGFIVLGTTYVYGEDLPCKGRVRDIIKYISSGSDSTSYPGS
jgi:hypothetical protein